MLHPLALSIEEFATTRSPGGRQVRHARVRSHVVGHIGRTNASEPKASDAAITPPSSRTQALTSRLNGALSAQCTYTYTFVGVNADKTQNACKVRAGSGEVACSVWSTGLGHSTRAPHLERALQAASVKEHGACRWSLVRRVKIFQ